MDGDNFEQIGLAKDFVVTYGKLVLKLLAIYRIVGSPLANDASMFRYSLGGGMTRGHRPVERALLQGPFKHSSLWG
jgi:hypothetical protein